MEAEQRSGVNSLAAASFFDLWVRHFMAGSKGSASIEGIYIIVFGVIVLAIGVVLVRKRRTIAGACTAQTTGRAEDVQYEIGEKREENGGRRQTEINGRTVSAKSSVDTSQPRFSPRAPVTVCYNPDQEQRYIAEDGADNALHYAVVIFGIAMIGIGMMLWFPG